MGYVINYENLNRDRFTKLISPIIFCVSPDKIEKFTVEYQRVSINEIMSKELLKYEPQKRALFIVEEFNKIIYESHDPIFVQDYEMLFNPEYQIDVLKLFILANRKRKIAIYWCGSYNENILRFSEPEYADYKTYNIKGYDITCII
jgi:hypothetical protein